MIHWSISRHRSYTWRTCNHLDHLV